MLTTEISQKISCSACGAKAYTDLVLDGVLDESSAIRTIEPLLKLGWLIQPGYDVLCPQHSGRMPLSTKAELFRRLVAAGFRQVAVASAYEVSRNQVWKAVQSADG